MIEAPLPKLEENFKQELLTLSQGVATSREVIKQRLQSCIKHVRKDIVQFEYVYLDQYQNYLDKLFSNKFNEKITYYLMVLRNVTDDLSIFPRHSDEIRLSGVNYYLSLGGDDVVTNFYFPDKVSFRAEQDKWYIFNACEEHEVLNISSTRIILGMDLESQPSYEDLKRRLL